MHKAVAAQCAALSQNGIDSFVIYVSRVGQESIRSTFLELGVPCFVTGSRWAAYARLLCRQLRDLLVHGSRSILHVHSGLAVITKSSDWLRIAAPLHAGSVMSLHGATDLLVREGNEHMWDFHSLAVARWSAVVVPSAAQAALQKGLCRSAGNIHSIGNVSIRAGTAPVAGGGGANGTPRMVVTIARLSVEKNLGAVISAFGVAADLDPAIQLLICGEGPARPGLQEHVQSLSAHIRDRVVLKGYVENPQQLLGPDTIFVSLSLSESFGLVAFEAAFAGAPMVLSRISPWVDFFESGRDCLFVEPHDTRAAGTAIQSLLADPDLRARLARNAVAAAEQHTSPVAIAGKWRQLYEAVRPA